MFYTKGSALLYVVLLLSILLTAVFGLSTIVSSQIVIMRGVGDSIIAFYAADAGVERMLGSIVASTEPLQQTGTDFVFSNTFSNGSFYEVKIYCRNGGGLQCGSIPEDSLCSADNYCIKSIGSYKKSKRAIKVMI